MVNKESGQNLTDGWRWCNATQDASLCIVGLVRGQKLSRAAWFLKLRKSEFAWSPGGTNQTKGKHEVCIRIFFLFNNFIFA